MIAPGTPMKFGWIPFEDRTPEQTAEHNRIVGAMPRFNIRGRFRAAERRYPLWLAGKKLLGKFLPYNFQSTGSCVGAGGGNMTKTSIAVEIYSKGDLEEYKEVWWPFTYGCSRGNTSEGDGSSGSSWAECATQDGFFEADLEGLPKFEERQGWLALSERIEYQWSTTRNIDSKWKELGKHHLFKTAAPMRSADDCAAAIINGYALTQASNFGFRSSKVRGTPQVRIAPWDGSWSHQTYVDEYWDHPTEGEIFRWGNNWGPDAHGAPTGDEPPGGVYITKATLDSICRNGEVYAFSVFNGFPARELSWLI